MRYYYPKSANGHPPSVNVSDAATKVPNHLNTLGKYTQRANYYPQNTRCSLIFVKNIFFMGVPANWFKEWFNSPYYHKLYIDRDEREAADFIERLVNHLNPPPHSLMLDAGCGRGRHARILAEKGFDVTGIDLAPRNISYALQFENDHLHFYEHDIRMPFWINYFDYAFNFFTSFGYFETEREHNNTIRTISQSMKPGGVFVLDYLNMKYAEKHFEPDATKEIDGIVFHIRKWCDDTHFYKKIIVEDNHLKTSLQFVERVARFNLPDFEKLFALQGLKITEVFGDYAFDAYDIINSPRLLMVAKKGK
jgi:SAM-dependent methyltransferase